MLSRVGWKITAYSVLVTTLTIVLASFMINQALDRQFIAYLAESENERNQQIIATIQALYRETPSWPGIREDLEVLSLVTNSQIRIIDVNGNLLFETFQMRRGPRHQSMMEAGNASTYTTEEKIFFDNAVRARVQVTTVSQRMGRLHNTQDILFRQTINNSVIQAGFLSLLFALLISYILSNRLTKPLLTLLTSVRNFGRGDLSQRVLITSNDEISWLNQAFNEMAANLQNLEVIRKKSTDDVAHELRTPLTTIRGYLEAMSDEVLEANKENLGVVYDETERLIQLVNDLHELAQAQAPLRIKEDVDMVKLIRALVSRFRSLFQEKQISLDLELPTSALIRSHGRSLERAIGNVLINAWKYTPKGGAVNIYLESNQEYMILKISDTGIGMSVDDLPFIFERFYRADISRSRSTGGTGIGLAITREIIEAHGGQISAKSEINVGSEFTIRLKL